MGLVCWRIGRYQSFLEFLPLLSFRSVNGSFVSSMLNQPYKGGAINNGGKLSTYDLESLVRGT